MKMDHSHSWGKQTQRISLSQISKSVNCSGNYDSLSTQSLKQELWEPQLLGSLGRGHGILQNEITITKRTKDNKTFVYFLDR